MYLNILKKDLKRKKTMNLILFIFIILAATFIASSANNLTAISTALDGFFEKAEIPDYWIATADKNENEKFYKFAEENQYDYKTMDMLQVNPYDMLINGIKFEYPNTAAITTLKNSTKIFDSNDEEITTVNDGEIYMNAGVMNTKKYNLNTGDTVTISYGGKTKDFTLKGDTKDAAFGSGMTGMTRMLISGNDFDYFCNENAPMLYSIFVYTKDTSFMDKFNLLELNTIMNVDYAVISTMYIMDMLMAGIVLIISICLMLISMVILRFTINFTMIEEFREIGVMKAIGIKNSKIRSLYIIKYFMISVIGSVIGFGLSIPFGRMLIKDVSKNIILGSSDRIWLNLIFSAAAGAIVILFCYTCTRKIKKFSPVDAIRNGENGERYSRKGIVHLSKIRISPVAFLAVNDIFSGLKRFAIMIVIFVLGLLLILLPVNTINTLRSDNLITWFNMAKCDHVISIEMLFDNNNNIELVNEKINNAKKFLNENNIEADVFQEIMFKANISHGDKRTTSLAFQGAGDITDNDYMYDEGSAPQNVNEVAVTGYIADQIGVKIGDDVVIKIGETNKKYTVCALFQSMNNMGEGIRFHHDEKLDYKCLSGSFGMQIRYTDDPDSKLIATRKTLLADHYTDGKIYTAGEYINVMIGDTAGQIESMKYLIIAVVLCINILVTVLMVKSFITKEKGEIALLKAIGFKNGSLVIWHTLRIGIILLIAIILASVLSTPLTHLTIEPVFRIMGAQSIEFEIKPLEQFVIYPLIVLAVTTLSAMLTALQIRKISSSEISNVE